MICAGFSAGSAATPESVKGNFSQQAGFARHFAEHPRRDSAATPEEQALLQRHRPRLWLPAGHPGPIDFYGDYIAQGSLVTGTGERFQPVDRDLLNRFKNDPAAVFSHRPGTLRPSPPAQVFGRVDPVDMELAPGQLRRFSFLSYHFVFRHSGLVAGMPWWKNLPLGLLGDPNDWHQLDHYTAATVVLNEQQRPVALMLQQHNGQRSLVFGETVAGQTLALPPDGRVELDAAERSNELYPHRAGRNERRAVNFVNPDTLPYLLGLGPATFMSSKDITHPTHEATYELGFLPPDDAFYSFAGYLGERRRLPGRDGPPGADYNIWPSLKPLGLQLLAGYWRDGDKDDLARLMPLLQERGDPTKAARAQAEVLGATLRRLGL